MMFPGRAQCKGVSGRQHIWGHLVICAGADLGLGGKLEAAEA